MSAAKERIPLARPPVGEGEIVAAERVIRSGRLTMGPETERFEALLAQRTGRAHAVAVASGTAALELSLWALGVGGGDRVAMTGFGFPAAANAIAARGGAPVAVDVEAAGWTMDPAALARTLGEGGGRDRSAGIKAIVSIDQLGLPARAAPLVAAAKAAGAALIDDAACALGARDADGVPGGGYGVLATLSFHPRKIITTGEGGAIVTDDGELAARLRELRNHGQAGPGRFVRVGTNARLGEIGAAMGAAQLERLDAMLAERRLLADGYRRRLAKAVAGGRVSLQEVPAGAMHAYQTFAVLLAAGIDRTGVIARLAADGIESGPATYAVHRLATHAGAAAGAAGAAGSLPVADALHDRALALPLWLGMRSGELDRVAEAVEAAVGVAA